MASRLLGRDEPQERVVAGNYTTLPRLRHLTSSIDSLAAQDSRPALGSKWLCHGLRGPNERELGARLNIYSLRLQFEGGGPFPPAPRKSVQSVPILLRLADDSRFLEIECG